MKYLILILLGVSCLQGCSTSGRLPLDFSTATPDRVERVTTDVATQLNDLGVPVERADIALLACGTIGAQAYFSLRDPATKEERLLAAIGAANRHGSTYYRDVLGEKSFLDFASAKLDLSKAMSDAEKWIGILRYFLFNLDDVESRLPAGA